jgi:hypothetical protein
MSPPWRAGTPRAQRLTRCIAALAVLASTFLLVGCSGKNLDDQGGLPSVASLATASPSASAKASTKAVDVNDQRPLIRFDTTPQEQNRLYASWTHCLVQHGGSRWSKPKLVMGQPGAATDPKNKAVLTACLAQEPEEEDVREARQDPSAYREDNRQWYQCAKAKGYDLTTPDPDTGEFGLTRIGPNGDFESPKITACKVMAFGWK